MDLGNFLSNYTYLFILIMLRYFGLFIITPIFSSQAFFSRFKAGLSFLLALVSLPVIQQIQNIDVPDHVLLIAADVLKEISIGFFMGFIVLLIFTAIQLAGQFIDLRMAFRLANAVNPMSDSPTPVVGQFKNIIAILVFLTLEGHHILIHNIYRSFSIIPIAQAEYSNEFFRFLFRSSGDLFILAFQIALPVFGTIFIVDVILGFLARAVPQMNLFIIGLPVKILVGFIFLLLAINVMINFFDDQFQQLFRDLLRLLQLMAPG
ncbi:MAG: flagellar biosynthetic protein FliR [Bacillota bacterium]